MKRKLTAFLLAVIMIVSSVPFTAFADTSAGGNGTGGGLAGGITGSGTFSESQTGYRMYLASGKTGQRVSNIVDFCYTAPVTSGIYATGTKLDDGLTGRGNIYVLGMDILYQVIGSTPTYPIRYSGGTFVGNGDQFKQWILNGKDSLSESGVSVDVSAGYKPSKEQTFPPDKGNEPITSTDVYATLEAIALNYLDTLYQLPHSEYNMSQYSAKAASGSTLQHLTNFINQAAAQNSLTAKQMQVVIA